MLPFLAGLPQKKLVLKENPSSDDQSFGPALLDVLGICSSCFLLFDVHG